MHKIKKTLIIINIIKYFLFGFGTTIFVIIIFFFQLLVYRNMM